MLQDMDPVMHNAPKDYLEHIGTANLKEMIRLIELARRLATIRNQGLSEIWMRVER